MRIAILGLGNMGRGLANRLAGKAELVLGTRDVDAAADFARSLSGDVAVADYHGAAEAADIVILALPYEAALAEAGANTALAGKPVIDITNPLKADYSGLTLGFSTSAAEEIQKAAPGAKIVKAFNTIFADLLTRPAEETAHLPVFVAGDDAGAVEQAITVVELAGFGSEKTGPLETARYVEPLGMLNIRLGYFEGRGQGIAPSWSAIAA
jgi:hypothetical protein